MVDQRARAMWVVLLVSALVCSGLLTGCRRDQQTEDVSELESAQEVADGQASGGQTDENRPIWHWDGDTRTLRNPFERPAWARRFAVPEPTHQAPETKEVKPVVLRLQGILYSERGCKALINGRWLKVGDEIQGNRVVKIDRNSVLLRKRNGSLIALRLANGR